MRIEHVGQGFWMVPLLFVVGLVLVGCERFDPETLGGQLGEHEGQPAVILDNGDVYLVDDDMFTGAIGHVGYVQDRVAMPGWAVNSAQSRSVTAVVIIVDGRIVASTAPDAARESAAERWGEQVNPAGFRLEVPFTVLANAAESPQFFALYRDADQEEHKYAGALSYRGRSRCMLEQLPDDPADCD